MWPKCLPFFKGNFVSSTTKVNSKWCTVKWQNISILSHSFIVYYILLENITFYGIKCGQTVKGKMLPSKQKYDKRFLFFSKYFLCHKERGSHRRLSHRYGIMLLHAEAKKSKKILCRIFRGIFRPLAQSAYSKNIYSHYIKPTVTTTQETRQDQPETNPKQKCHRKCIISEWKYSILLVHQRVK